MRILLVEDDPLLGDALRIGIEQQEETYMVEWVLNGTDAKRHLIQGCFDFMVLDLALPIPYSGFDVLRYVRSKNIDIPVLILTAKESISDKVFGLDSGADDYMVKPVDLEELCARIRALQRRTSHRSKPLIEYGALQVDPAAHKVMINKEVVILSRREFALVLTLMENIGRVISREKLAQSLYGWRRGDVDSNALEVHIHNVRKKLQGALPIRTIRGVGYIVEKEEHEPG